VLSTYKYDSILSEYLLQGFSFGFKLDFQGPPLNHRCSNLKSAVQSPAALESKLNKEISAGRVKGPFSEPPLSPHFNVSPIGLHPKKTPGEFRLIHHLSFPPGNSVNSFIPQAFSSVHYATIDDAISSILKCGNGCFLAKSDIKSAFRLIPLHPTDHPLLGFSWKDQFYYDCCLPMGASSSCAIFERFSTALEYIISCQLLNCYVHHVLDDFIFISSSESSCRLGLKRFQDLCHHLGVPLAEEKTVGPSQTLTFLGIELDTLEMEARLPDDKLFKCRQLIQGALGKKSLLLKSLQSILGVLNFACSVVVPGRAFLRRLTQLLVGRDNRHSHLHLRLSRGSKLDLITWKSFLTDFNGKSFFLGDRWQSNYSLTLYTDAAKSLGFGAVFGRSWFYGLWPTSWQVHHISLLELYPIVLAVETWANDISNRCIILFTDNEAVVSVINSQTSKDENLMILVRRLVLICLKFNIVFQAKHVPGAKNTLADLLSRQKLDQFKQLVGDTMDPLPTPVPVPPAELTSHVDGMSY